MAASGRHVSKILWAYIIELPQLVGGGGCVMTYLHISMISNRLAVNHKKTQLAASGRHLAKIL